MSTRNGYAIQWTYESNGNPNLLSASELNPPVGAIVFDYTTPAWWLCTAPQTYIQVTSLAGAQIVTEVSPLTGATVDMNTASNSEFINITPAGTIAALTVVFPSDADSAIGQVETLVSSQTVTTLTVTSAGLTLKGDAVTTLNPNQPVSWIKTAAATWQRLQTPAAQALTNLLATPGSTLAIRDQIQTVNDASPLTGGTINCNALGKDDIQFWTPAGTIAAQTYVFPSDANSQLGQIIEITSTHIVSTLTLTTSGLTIVGTSQSALAVNTPARWRKVAAATWLVLA